MSNSPKKGVGSPGKGRMTGDGTGGREGGVAAWSLAKLEVKCLDWTGTERGLVGSREGSATKHKAKQQAENPHGRPALFELGLVQWPSGNGLCPGQQRLGSCWGLVGAPAFASPC